MLNSLPLVTIGIPTYNRANGTLREALRSALLQDYPNLEIIVSDNGSQDDTREVVESFQDKRITYVGQATNIGPTNNYNACLSVAKGDYFLLLHDDDLIDVDFVSTCLRAANHSGAYALIRTGTRMIDHGGKVTREVPNQVPNNEPDELFRAWVHWRTSFYFCSTLFNTRALKAIGGFRSPNNLFEDGFAIIKLSADHPIINITEAKASFRTHDDQRTFAQNPLHWYEDFRQALDLIYLQAPAGRVDIYREGMRSFSIISFRFALKVSNPVKRTWALLMVGKYFPTRYWPDTSKSWKLKLVKRAARLLFSGKDSLHQS